MNNQRTDNSHTLTWSVNDGYVVGDRPQRTRIDIEELVATCTDEDEVRQAIADSVQASFDQKVSPSWDPDAENKLVQLWQQARALADADDDDAIAASSDDPTPDLDDTPF